MKYRLSLLFAALLLLNCPVHAQQKKIPKLKFQNLNGKEISNSDIPKDKALLLIYLRTDCNECRRTAQVMQQSADKYPAEIWMVSYNSLDTLQTFAYMSGLLQKKNLLVLRDNQDLMHHYFQFKWLPFIILFDKNGKEVKTYEYLPDAGTVTKDLSESK